MGVHRLHFGLITRYSRRLASRNLVPSRITSRDEKSAPGLSGRPILSHGKTP
jgi:hypothetical protein